MTRSLRVLIVDDSAFNRRTLGDILAQIPHVEVLAKAGDGDDALKLALDLQPDLITLDLEMPRMDGFTFLRILMARRPTPVIVVSSRSGKADVFRALELGAVDFIAKPSSTASQELLRIRGELEQKVALVRKMKPLVPREVTGQVVLPLSRTPDRRAPLEPFPRRVAFIAASTGGPPALVRFFSRLQSDLPLAIVIAQHMPEKFTLTFAERLDRLNGMRVSELQDREQLRSGRAFVCPGGRSVEVSAKANGIFATPIAAPREDRYVPSADRLFESAAMAYGHRAIGIVMTGMGDDGTRGALAIKARGGTVLAEAEELAAIGGMPGSAIRSGAVDFIGSIEELADKLQQLAR